MPTYAKFMKELLIKKKYIEKDNIEFEAGYSAIIHKMLFGKHQCHGRFTIPIMIGNFCIGRVFLDLGENINLMPLFMLEL